MLKMTETNTKSNENITRKTKIIKSTKSKKIDTEDIDSAIDLITTECNSMEIDINKKVNKLDEDIKLKSKNKFTDKQIEDEYNKSKIKKWIKLIDFENTIEFNKYNNIKDFVKVADIKIDNEKKDDGVKKRKTVIQFIPSISDSEFKSKNEWIYILTIGGKIVKIGGTRDGLKGRVGSYLCGHHIQERGKSGDCSKTNAYIYNTFDFYLNLGFEIEMYGYKLPNKEFEIEILGKKTMVKAQTYHAYETIYLEDYKNNYKSYPQLSDNCDSNYKN